jgi:probable addiction module antidote protein
MCVGCLSLHFHHHAQMLERDAGLGRESLYRARSTEGNGNFATIIKIITALGLTLHASPGQTAVI